MSGKTGHMKQEAMEEYLQLVDRFYEENEHY
jgi:hypothetical protein